MGNTLYSSSARLARSVDAGYETKTVFELFKQSAVRKVHDSLSVFGLNKREAFDSELHPESEPVILGADVTGSMGHIPHMLIKNGLPRIMTTLIANGVHHAAVCMVSVGDHLVDEGILQASQFESGDEELDTHLTNMWLEGGGGGNGGESYPLVWKFANEHTDTHAWTKRGRKGVLITWGDENFHKKYDKYQLDKIFGGENENTTAAQLYKQASEKWHIHHLGLPSSHDMKDWKSLLGENFHDVKEYEKIPEIISQIVVSHSLEKASSSPEHINTSDNWLLK